MFYEKFIGGGEGDGAPCGSVVKTVVLTFGDAEVDGFRAARFPFRVGGVPAGLSFLLVSEEDDGGREVGLEVGEDVDSGIFFVSGREGGVEPEIGDYGGVDVLRVDMTPHESAEFLFQGSCAKVSEDGAMDVLGGVDGLW